MKKDIKLLIFMIITVILSVVNLVARGKTDFIFYVLLGSVLSILDIYYSYPLLRLKNRWNNVWTERKPGDGEPTEIYLVYSKMGGWAVYILFMTLSLFV